MDTTRRDFLGTMAMNAAMLGAMPLSFDLATAAAVAAPAQGEKWDLTWVNRVTGKHKAVFDVPEVDSGYGVWRATIWGKQYQEVMGVSPKDLSAVLVLRHNGITLAMQQALGTLATAVRSQSYYLDVTPPGCDKGTFVESIARLLNISTDAVATIGDMQNDLAMFRKSGVSIAMGNATDDVKSLATHITRSNEDEGFAGAVDIILQQIKSG